MDPKTLVVLFLVFAGVGSTVNSVLRIAGLTKNVVVEGGNGPRVVAMLASAVSLVGWLIFLYTLMFHGDVFIRASEFLFGG